MTARRALVAALLLPLVALACPLPSAAQTAVGVELGESLYRRSIDALYQVRVLDTASGEKTHIGTGFQISDDGLVATNYHVIAAVIHRPDRHELELVGSDERNHTAELLAVDVVNDLALLRLARPAGTVSHHLELGELPDSNGAALFSIGDPIDLGMSIVHGAYNGIVDTSLYKKVLFSGALNPGMSGGPTLDRDGNVVGVNVSTWGNELGFLVPIDALRALVESRAATSEPEATPGWKAEIERQVLDNQSRFVDAVLARPWERERLGPLLVPTGIGENFDCWGGRLDEDLDLYEHVYSHCSSGDVLYLSDLLETGEFIYRYEWLESRGLDRFRFHRLYESTFDLAIGYENADLEEVSSFSCRTRHVEIGGRPWRAALCARRYVDYPRLYDAHLSLALVGEAKLGFLVQVVAQGVGREQARGFFHRFMEEIEWAD